MAAKTREEWFKETYFSNDKERAAFNFGWRASKLFYKENGFQTEKPSTERGTGNTGSPKLRQTVVELSDLCSDLQAGIDNIKSIIAQLQATT